MEHPTLLIVDDCDLDREIVREYLAKDETAHYEIFEAEAAAEGLAFCQEIQCDLILLDFRLPDMTGLEFLHQWQQQSGALPSVIMMTGQGCETVAVQAMKRGAENYLLKQDLEPDTLIQAVQEALGQKRSRLASPNCEGSLLTASCPSSLEAMAAAALRFRRFLHLSELLDAAVTEIQQITRCDRATIVQDRADPADRASQTPLPSHPLAQSQSLRFSTPIQSPDAAPRQRGRPPKASGLSPDASPLELMTVRLPIRLPQASSTVAAAALTIPVAAWGWIILDYLPETLVISAEEEVALGFLADQLAIAIDHAQQFGQALERLHHFQDLGQRKLHQINQSAVKARRAISTVLTTANTLAKHRTRLSQQQQDQFLSQLEERSRDLASLWQDIEETGNGGPPRIGPRAEASEGY